uniref:Uncharacterized protein n=1 Tax=Cannabis sativa TaxID=3483 RepID=A0A803PLI8_CANSA
MITSTKNLGDKEKRKCLMKSDLGAELKRVAFDVQEFGCFKISIPHFGSSYGPILEYIFDKNLDSDEPIVDTDFHYLNRRLLSILALEVMLSGEILNVVWDMLTRAERLGSKGGRKRWFLNTWMSCSISVDKLFPSTVKGNRDGGKESAQQFYIGDLAICKEVEIWDSLLNNGKSSGEDMVKPVWLEHRSVVDSKFHSYNERARIEVKIVTSEMNKLKDKVNFASLRDCKPFTQCANS